MALPYDPALIRTVDGARQVMATAKARGDDDAYRSAFRRYCQLSGRSGDDAFEQDVDQAIAAFEQARTEATGRKAHASRTHQKRNRAGSLRLVSDLVEARKPSEGFDTLVAGGLASFTFEAVALRHPQLFSPKTLEAARERLSNRDGTASLVRDV